MKTRMETLTTLGLISEKLKLAIRLADQLPRRGRQLSVQDDYYLGMAEECLNNLNHSMRLRLKEWAKKNLENP